MTLHRLRHLSRTGRAAARRDGGALSLELAILAPAVIMILLLVIAAGRIYLSGSTVDDAARDAARAASLQRNATTAQATALQVATSALAAQGIHCSSTSVDVPVDGFNAPLGQPATVTVTVKCQVNLADVAFPGLPGTKIMTGTFTSAIDPYRQRALGSRHPDVVSLTTAGNGGGHDGPDA
ncbi:TadE/TadG family type IV pilus assembly protein [Streptacidiphilus sp. EB129]|uniref:TadE/TadG family type IV pilus assembly protein n=1 Tax=Streptacidiphilus sp. EB129 TaxID=3156262 RepID=UPI003511B634